MEELMEMVRDHLRSSREKDGRWEVGDKEAIVCNDAVIIISMNEGRELKIDIIAGVPTKVDRSFHLTEECE